MDLQKNTRYTIWSIMKFLMIVMKPLSGKKELKTWKRQWKIELIEKNNPDWVDLYKELI